MSALVDSKGIENCSTSHLWPQENILLKQLLSANPEKQEKIYIKILYLLTLIHYHIIFSYISA